MISLQFDVSMDWLVGFPVPKRLTEREKLGALRDDLHAELLHAVRVKFTGAHQETLEQSSGRLMNC